jgi:hypothetical protein
MTFRSRPDADSIAPDPDHITINESTKSRWFLVDRDAVLTEQIDDP